MGVRAECVQLALTVTADPDEPRPPWEGLRLKPRQRPGQVTPHVHADLGQCCAAAAPAQAAAALVFTQCGHSAVNSIRVVDQCSYLWL